MGDPELGLGPIEVPRGSDLLADRLRRRVLDGDLSPGTWLPPERELAAETGLSRGSVRSALLVLETEGLVETKQGRNGGTIVRRPDVSSVVRSLETFIRGRRIRFRSLLEIRELIEPACAAQAAERCTPDDLDRLLDISDRLRAHVSDLPTYLTENVEWHVAIAEASQNELLAAFMKGISREIRLATDLDSLNSDQVVGEALRAHDRVIDAIKARDPDAARRRMQRHVCAFSESFRSQAEPVASIDADGNAISKDQE